jgi:uncharacterized membrane protein YkoI
MKINRKFLLALGGLIVLGIFAAALVAAQGSQPAPDTEEDGEEESLTSPSEAALSQDEAVAIAEQYTGSTAAFVELENEGGTVVYSVELEDGSEVEVDGNTGDILEVEGAGADDD